MAEPTRRQSELNENAGNALTRDVPAGALGTNVDPLDTSDPGAKPTRGML
jgi:hypothetical protein